jgi:hypothetical protein
MNIPPFDDVSRLAARGELSKSLARVLAVGLQGLLGALATKAQAQPIPSPCDVSTLNACLTQAQASGRANLSACMTACLAQTDAALMSLECAACVESSAAMVEAEIRRCHTSACGGRSGEYCSQAPGSLSVKVCCPLGSRYYHSPSRGGWGCHSGCGFQCGPPYVLDPEFCTCVCDPRLGVCP